MSIARNTIDQYISQMKSSGMKNNQLLQEKSPYLLQHAFNPVSWFAWGDAPLEKALRENKPIFVSIGYSTCHWCHVMAHESFEDEMIAEILNQYFVAIKVDREERPDIDQTYMAVTQAMTGGGGWPTSIFLTPDLKPFFAGTYFPARTTVGRTGFYELLDSIRLLWQEDSAKIKKQADEVVEKLADIYLQPLTSAKLGKDVLQGALRHYQDNYDEQFGGFGIAPKFPRPVSLLFLLKHHEVNGEESSRRMAVSTLKKMAFSGLFDHLGGGFHRYSVDRQWMVPHFEKMLYDQALMAVSYAIAYQMTGEYLFKEIALKTLYYVSREMRDDSGGFYCAEDADSALPENPAEKGEGAFYLWRYEDMAAILNEEELLVTSKVYGVLPDGNVTSDPQGEFTGKNILFRGLTNAKAAELLKKNELEVGELISSALAKLEKNRESRPRPHLDDKILTSWNALMISAFVKGYQVFGVTAYRRVAERAADFLLAKMFDENKKILLRRYRQGEAGINGNLDDYAFLVQGLLDLYDSTSETKWLNQAEKLCRLQEKYFLDPAHDNFFDAYERFPNVIAGLKNDYDGAEPCGNSVSALNFLRIGNILGDEDLMEVGVKIIRSFAGQLSKAPYALPYMLLAVNYCAAVGKAADIFEDGDL